MRFEMRMGPSRLGGVKDYQNPPLEFYRGYLPLKTFGIYQLIVVKGFKFVPLNLYMSCYGSFEAKQSWFSLGGTTSGLQIWN